MRTKTTLAAAAILAAGLASSMAQANVYSLNVVGYVNKTYDAGVAYMVSSPLSNGGNTLKDIIPTPPGGSFVFRWDFAAQDISGTPDEYNAGLGTWGPNPVIAPGQGFLFVPAATFVNTYVGEVRQGASGNVQILGGGAEMIGSPVPIAGNENVIMANYPAIGGDFIFLWELAAQNIYGTPSEYNAGLATWSAGAVPIGLADGFLLVRNGGPVTWVRNFIVAP